LAWQPLHREKDNDMFNWIIRNGLLVDGTGDKPFLADIAVKDGWIARIGNLDGDAERVIDATGKIVARASSICIRIPITPSRLIQTQKAASVRGLPPCSPGIVA
jgi:urease alpha subunit